MSYHRTEVIGNLTDDPELKYVGETPKTTFSVAVNERFKDKERVTYYDVEAWEQKADFAAEYLRKGRKVFVAGRMQMDTFEDREGAKRKKWFLRADTVQALDRPAEDDDRPQRRRRDEDDDRPRRRREEPRSRSTRDDPQYDDLPF